jgi:hypothetical protein
MARNPGILWNSFAKDFTALEWSRARQNPKDAAWK